MKRILINPEMCQGCRNCQLACMVEHGTAQTILTLDLEDPANQSRNYIEAGPGGRPVPLLCRHCDEPACVTACMSGALGKDPHTGVVGHDPVKCAGCWMCVMSCPYGIIRPEHQYGKTAIKCDFCATRPRPRCVEACPTGAITLVEPDPQGGPEYNYEAGEGGR